MEKYTKAQMEIIEFENEDVIMASSCDTKTPEIGGLDDDCRLD